jgi:acid phosphatase family membrane protein YuiD
MSDNSPEAIFQNKILMTTVAVWFIAQSIKVVLGVWRERRFNFKWLIGTGGMPSSHAAGVAALATSCGLYAGFISVSFALAAVFALVTMFDAQGVRRSAGQQAGILNQMIEDIYAHQAFRPERLFELIGHTPLQVLIGALLGVFLAVFFYRIW